MIVIANIQYLYSISTPYFKSIYSIHELLIPNSDDKYWRFLVSMCDTRSLLSIMFRATLKLFQMDSDMVLTSLLS